MIRSQHAVVPTSPSSPNPIFFGFPTAVGIACLLIPFHFPVNEKWAPGERGSNATNNQGSAGQPCSRKWGFVDGADFVGTSRKGNIKRALHHGSKVSWGNVTFATEQRNVSRAAQRPQHARGNLTSPTCRVRHYGSSKTVTRSRAQRGNYSEAGSRRRVQNDAREMTRATWRVRRNKDSISGAI